MSRNEVLKKRIERFLKKEQLFKNEQHKKLEKPFLAKSRKNFSVANLMFRISEQENLRKALNLPSDFDSVGFEIV